MTISLSRFRAAVRNSDVKLTKNTKYRYQNGAVPKRFIQFLIDHPDVAAALYADIVSAASKSTKSDTKPLDTTY